MKVKTCPITVKTAGAHEGVDEGVFEAVVAAYNVDSVGDRIIPGAFGKSLGEWKDSGNPIPVIWSHKSDDPDYHIGHVLEAEERPEGLWIKARIDIEDSRSKSAQVYRLLKGRRVTQMSFAYDEVQTRPAQKDDSGGAVKELLELKVYEVGPCLIGANQQTALLAVKQGATSSSTVTVKVGDRDVSALVEAGMKQQLAELAADGQVCEVCGAPGHTICFDAKNSDAADSAEVGRVPSKENEDALRSALADLTVKLGQVGDLLAARSGAAAEVQASPTVPADSPPEQATEIAPADDGTASVHQPDVLMSLALLEAEHGAYTI